MGNNIQIVHSEEFIDKSEKITLQNRINDTAVPHTHQFIELVYVYEGSGCHIINNHRYNLSPGDMLFINYGQVHIIEGDPSMNVVNILFLPEFVSNSLMNSENVYDLFAFILSDELNHAFDFTAPVAHFSVSDRIAIENLIFQMLDEYNKKEPNYRMTLKAYLQIVICKMIRNIRKQEDLAQHVFLQKIAPEIINFIDVNFSDKIDLQSLAKKSFYSPSYFSRLFKESYGKTLSEYVKEKRIAEAVRLLTSTSTPISKISELVGYNNKRLFNQFFKQITGMSPSEYRSSHSMQHSFDSDSR